MLTLEEILASAKVLFPADGITKGRVADYYRRIADTMLPWIGGRPLTLRQFPEGIGEEGFFHKHAAEHYPRSIRRIEVPLHSKPGEIIEMVSADEADDLVWFAGHNTIEVHMALSKVGSLEFPDQLIFDFDPSNGDFEKVRESAFKLKEILDARNLQSFVKTSGSRGVHVHVPLDAKREFAEVKGEAKAIAAELNGALPDITTLEHRIKKRGDRVYLDVLRNDYGMNVVAPYSLRARAGAPVATPIDWDELADTAVGPKSWTVDNIFRRLGQKADPWQNFKP